MRERIGDAASTSGLIPGLMSRIAAGGPASSTAAASGGAAAGASLPPGLGRMIVASRNGSSSGIASALDRPQFEIDLGEFAADMNRQAAGAAGSLQLPPERPRA